VDRDNDGLTPASQLARENPVRIPHESAEYRAARTALLAEEIELRRHIERVAALRRSLPPGGKVEGDYRFMFGPQRARGCPMCSNMLASWDGTAADIGQMISLVVVARSPIERLRAWKRERGWKHLRLVSDLNDNYSRNYLALLPDGEEIPAFHVFTRRDGAIRHFGGGEMSGSTADPGQDPRGAPDFSPLWTVLDTTPEGRRPDWYPKLDY